MLRVLVVQVGSERGVAVRGKVRQVEVPLVLKLFYGRGRCVVTVTPFESWKVCSRIAWLFVTFLTTRMSPMLRSSSHFPKHFFAASLYFAGIGEELHPAIRSTWSFIFFQAPVSFLSSRHSFG